MIQMRIVVLGLPAPQGSKRHVGRGIMIESSKKVAPWREAVTYAAFAEAKRSGRIGGAVSVEITFTVPKPKSAPKTRVTWPDKKPDLDKLCRSTFDALVSGGAIEDDSRVIDLVARKRFPGEHRDALEVPGAVISIISVSQSSEERVTVNLARCGTLAGAR